MGSVKIKEHAGEQGQGCGEDGERAAGGFGAAQAEDPHTDAEEEGGDDGGENQVGIAIGAWEGAQCDRVGFGQALDGPRDHGDIFARRKRGERVTQIPRVMDIPARHGDQLFAKLDALLVQVPAFVGAGRPASVVGHGLLEGGSQER